MVDSATPCSGPPRESALWSWEVSLRCACFFAVRVSRCAIGPGWCLVQSTNPGGPMTNRAAAVLTIAVLRSADALRTRLSDARGQGTVEYVGLILLVAGVLAAVVVWATSKAGDQGIGKKVINQLNTAIDRTAGGAHK